MTPYGQVIIIKKTGEDGSSFPLLTNTCKIGRGHVCDIRIQRESVSEEHCIIEARTDTQVWTRNLTNNTTLLNGVPLSKDWVALKHKDVIIISDRSFRWEYLPKSKFYSDVGAPCQQNTKTPYKVVEDKRKSIMQNSPMKRKGTPKSNVEAKLASSNSNLDGIMFSNMTTLCNEKLEPAHFIGKEDNIQLGDTPVMSELENICEQGSRKRKLSTVTPKPSLINRLAVTRVVKTPMSHGKISSTPKSVIKLEKQYSLITPERAASSGEIIKKKVQHTEMPNTEGKENLNSQGKASLSNKNTEGDTLSLSDCLKENHLVTTPVTTQKKPTADFSLNFESRLSPKTSACDQVLILDEISDSPEDKVFEKISDKKKKYRKSLRTPKGVDSFELVGGFHEKEKCNEEQFYSPLCADVTVLEPKLKANVDSELSDLHIKEYLQKTPNSNAVIELIQRRSMRTPRMRVSSGVSPFKCDASILSHEESVNSHKSMSVLKEDLIKLTGATPETSCITTKLAITPKSVMKLKLKNSTKSLKKVGFPLSDIEKSQKENVKNQSNIIFSETNISASKRSAHQIEGSKKNEVGNGKKEKQAYECISDVTHSSACKGRSFRKRLLTASTEKDEIKSKPIELSCTNSITQNKPVDGGWSVTEIFNKTPENVDEINANGNFVHVVPYIKETPVGVWSVEEPLNPIQEPKTSKSESFDKPQSSSDMQLFEDEKSHEIQFIPIADHMSKHKRQDKELKRMRKRQNKSLKAEEISQWAVREINADELNLNDSSNTLQKRRSLKEKLKIETPVIKRLEKKILTGSLDEEDDVMHLMQTPHTANTILQNSEKSIKGQHNTRGSTMEPQQESQSMVNVVGEQTEGTKDIQPSSSRDNEREVTLPIPSIEKDEEVRDICKKTPSNRKSVTEKSQFATPALTKSAKKKAIESSTYTDDIQELVQTPLSENSNPQESQLSDKSLRKSRRSSIVSTEGSPSLLIDAAESSEESTYLQFLSSGDEKRLEELLKHSACINEEIVSDLSRKTPKKRKSVTEKSSFATSALTKSVKKKTIESPNYTEGIQDLMQTPLSVISNLQDLQMSGKSQHKTRRSAILSTKGSPSQNTDAVESNEELRHPQIPSSSDEDIQDDLMHHSASINEEIVSDLSKNTPRNRKSDTEKSSWATPALTKSLKKKAIESSNYTDDIQELVHTPLSENSNPQESQLSAKSQRKTRGSSIVSTDESPSLLIDIAGSSEESTHPHQPSSSDEERQDGWKQRSDYINEEIVSDLSKITQRNRKYVTENSPFATPVFTKSVMKKTIQSPNYTEAIQDSMQTPLSVNSNLQEMQMSGKSQRKTRSSIVSTDESPLQLTDATECSDESTHLLLLSSSDEEGQDNIMHHSANINEEIVSDLSKKTPRNRKSVTDKSSFATPALTKSVRKKVIDSPNYTEGIQDLMQTPLSGNSNLQVMQMSGKSQRKTRRTFIVSTEGSSSQNTDAVESGEELRHPQIPSSSDEDIQDDLMHHSASINEEIVSDLNKKTPRNRKSVADKSSFATPALKKSVRKKAIDSPSYTEGIQGLMQTPPSENSNLQEMQMSGKSQRKTRKSFIVSTEVSPSQNTDAVESSEELIHPQIPSSSDEDIQDDLMHHSASINEEIVSDLSKKTPRTRKSVTEKSLFATPALTKSVTKKAVDSPNYTEGIQDLMQTPLSENSNLQEMQMSGKSQRKTRRTFIVSTEGSSSQNTDAVDSSEELRHPQIPSSSDEDIQDDLMHHSASINEEIVSDLSKKTPRTRKSVTEKSLFATPALTKSVKKKAIDSPNYTEGIQDLMQTPLSENSNLQKMQMSGKSQRRTRKSFIVSTEVSPSQNTDAVESSEELRHPQIPSSSDEDIQDDLMHHSASINEEIVSDLNKKTPRNRKSVTDKSSFATPALKKSVRKKAIDSPSYTGGIQGLMQTPPSENSNLQEMQMSGKSQRKTRKSFIVSTEVSPSQNTDAVESNEELIHPQIPSSSDEDIQDDLMHHSASINEEIVSDLNKKTPRNRKSVTEKSLFATSALTKSVTKMAVDSPNYTEGIQDLMQTPLSENSNLQEMQMSGKSQRKTRKSFIVSTEVSPLQNTDAVESSEELRHPQIPSSSDDDIQDDLMHHSASINEEIVSDLSKKTPRTRKSVTEKSLFATPALTKSMKKKAIDSPNYTEGIQDLMQTPLSENSNLQKMQMSGKSQRKTRKSFIVSTEVSPLQNTDAVESSEELIHPQIPSSSDEDIQDDLMHHSASINEEIVSDLSKKTPRTRKSVTEKSLFATPALTKSMKKKAIDSPNYTEGIQDLMQTPLSENSNLQKMQMSGKSQRKTRKSFIVSTEVSPLQNTDAVESSEELIHPQIPSSSDEDIQVDLMHHSASINEEIVSDLSKKTPRTRKSVTEKSLFATPALTKSVTKKAVDSPNYTEGIQDLMQTPLSENSNLQEMQMSGKSQRKTRRTFIVSTEGSSSQNTDAVESSEELRHPQIPSSSDEDLQDDLMHHSASINEEIVSDLSKKTPRTRKSVTEKSLFATPALTKSMKKKAIDSPNYTEGIQDLMQTPLSENSNLQDLLMSGKSQRKTSRSTIVSTEVSPSLLIDVAERSEESTHPHLPSASDEVRKDGCKQHSACINEEIVSDLSKKTSRNRKFVTEKSVFATPALKRSVKRKAIDSPNYLEGIQDLMQTPLSGNSHLPESRKSAKSQRKTRSSIVSTDGSLSLQIDAAQSIEVSTQLQFLSSDDEETHDELTQQSSTLIEKNVSDLSKKTPRNMKSVTEKSLFATIAVKKSVKKKAIESPNCTGEIEDLLQTPLSENSNLHESQLSAHGQRKTRRSTIVSADGSLSLRIDAALDIEVSTCVNLLSSSDDERQNALMLHSSSLSEENVSYLSKKTLRNRKSVIELSSFATPGLTKSIKRKVIQSPKYTEGTLDLMQTSLSENSNLQESQMSAKNRRKTRSFTDVPSEGSPAVLINEGIDRFRDVQLTTSCGEETGDESVLLSSFSNEEDKSDFKEQTPVNLKSITEKSQCTTSASACTHRSPYLLSPSESGEGSMYLHSTSSTAGDIDDSSLHSPREKEEGVGNSSKITPRNRNSRYTMRSMQDLQLKPEDVAVRTEGNIDVYPSSSSDEDRGDESLSRSPRVNKEGVTDLRRKFGSDVVDIVSSCNSEKGVNIIQSKPRIGPVHVSISASPEEYVSNVMSSLKNISQNVHKKAGNSPISTYEDISGLKELMTRKSPESRYSDFRGVREIFTAKSPECNYLNVSGMKDLFNLSSTSVSKDTCLGEKDTCHKGLRRSKTDTDVNCSVGSLGAGISVQELLNGPCPVVLLSKLDCKSLELSPKGNKKQVHNKSRCLRTRLGNHKDADSVVQDGDNKKHQQRLLQLNESNCNEAQMAKDMIQTEEQKLAPRSMRATRRNKGDTTQSSNSQKHPPMHNAKINEKKNLKSHASKSARSKSEVKDKDFDEAVLVASAEIKPSSSKMVKGQDGNVITADVKSMPVESSLVVKKDEEVADQISSTMQKRSLRKALTSDPDCDDSNKKDTKKRKRHNVTSYESVNEGISISPNVTSDLNFNPRRKTRSTKKDNLETPPIEKVLIEESKGVFATRISIRKKIASSNETEENDSTKETTKRRKNSVNDKLSIESNSEDCSSGSKIVNDVETDRKRKTRSKKADLTTLSNEKVTNGKDQVKSSEPVGKGVDDKLSIESNSEDCSCGSKIVNDVETDRKRKTRSKKADLTTLSNEKVTNGKDQVKSSEPISKGDINVEMNSDLKKITKSKKTVNFHLSTHETTDEENQDNAVTMKSSLRKKALSSKGLKESTLSEENIADEDKTGASNLENLNDDLVTAAASKSDLRSKEVKRKGRKPVHFKEPEVEKMEAKNDAVTTDRRCLRRKTLAKKEENIADEDKTGASNEENLDDDLATTAASKSDLQSKEVMRKGRKPIHFKEPEVEKMQAKNDAVATDRRCLRRKTLANDDVADEKDKSVAKKRKTSNSLSEETNESSNGTLIHTDGAYLSNVKRVGSSRVLKSKSNRTDLIVNEEIQDSSNTERCSLRKKTLSSDDSESIRPKRGSKTKIPDADKENGISDSENCNTNQNPPLEKRFNLRTKNQEKTGEVVDAARKKGNKKQLNAEEEPVPRRRKFAR